MYVIEQKHVAIYHDNLGRDPNVRYSSLKQSSPRGREDLLTSQGLMFSLYHHFSDRVGNSGLCASWIILIISTKDDLFGITSSISLL